MVSCQSLQIAAPVRPNRWTAAIWVGHRLAASAQISAGCDLRRTDSRPRDDAEFSNPAGFDKMTSRAIHQSLTGAAGNAAKKSVRNTRIAKARPKRPGFDSKSSIQTI